MTAAVTDEALGQRKINRILLHFSVGANWFYEHVDQILEDLAQVKR